MYHVIPPVIPAAFALGIMSNLKLPLPSRSFDADLKATAALCCPGEGLFERLPWAEDDAVVDVVIMQSTEF